MSQRNIFAQKLMANQNFSESEQMYLVTLAQLETASQPVPLSALAQALGVQPVSVNQMVRKLAEAGLVTYEPYHGVSLSPQG
ncbi:MAG: MarR family transcriptional regulator, partial [Anaerolineae bacterium]